MSRKKTNWKILPQISLRQAVGAGLFFCFLIIAAAGHGELMSLKTLALSTVETLKYQCISFNRIVAADRTKSLFRLTDMMQDFSRHLSEENQIINDAYLEEYVDRMRLSGIALLDGNLRLEASGYTRDFRNEDWELSYDGAQYADIVSYPEKIFAERLESAGEYYDVCAVSRKDAPGILIGFYRQPTGLISDTENELESLLTGLQLRHNGHYAILEQGLVRATSDADWKGRSVSDSSLLKRLIRVPKDTSLHLIFADRHGYLGYRTGCENYVLCVYYPLTSVFSVSLTAGAVFAALYFILCCFYFFVRSQTLLENQEELKESNRQLTETVNILRALETVYFTLFYVDLERDAYEAVYLTSWLQGTVPERGIYTELKQFFLNTMIVPEDRENVDQRMSIPFIRENLSQNQLTEVRKSFYTDYQAIKGDIRKWCRVSAVAVDYDEEGKPRHILALLQDVDREKAKEASYQAQIIKEAEAAKIANQAKTEFLRRISHDIRTPINGIMGYVELGASYPDDVELQKHCRENAMTALHTLLELVTSVLEMSKLESGNIVLQEKPFDLSQVLTELDAIFQPQAKERNIRCEIQKPENDEPVNLIGSYRHLTQILMNLVSNAVKYGKPGGYLRLETHLVSQEGETVLYEFTCEDDGIGMSREFQKHMYESFAQEAEDARTVYMGSGLGLPIAKKLVEAMGGSMSCQSRKNEGTRFCVRLPFRTDPAQKDSGESVRDACGRLLKDRHILLVEDNELNMEIAEYFLTRYGAQVTKAWNGQEGVEAFAASNPFFYDLIILDVMMPVLDGPSAARAIRAMERPDAKTVPVMAMSANAFDEDVEASMEAGMNAHISKPVEEKALLTAIQELLEADMSSDCA